MLDKRFQFRRTLLSARGFTLLELLIVMVIIAIIAGTVAPRLISFAASRNAANAARQIVSLATYAHSQAIAEARVYHLNVDPSAGSYWLTADKDGQFTAPTNEFGQKYELPDGVKMDSDIARQSDGGTYVKFDPTGRGEQATMTLTDQNGKKTVVTCASATEMFHIASAAEASTVGVRR